MPEVLVFPALGGFHLAVLGFGCVGGGGRWVAWMDVGRAHNMPGGQEKVRWITCNYVIGSSLERNLIKFGKWKKCIGKIDPKAKIHFFFIT